MDYIDVHRRFAPIEPEKPFSAEAWQGTAGRFFGGLGWAELLERPRVVILAEAAAGKSAEFRARVDAIVADDGFAFYLTVESLASQGIEASFGRVEATRFETWQRSAADAWFFLDSVDEARLNHKSVEQALNRFARELGPAYDRARILLSCRGTVWTGKADLELVRRTLRPPTPRPEAVEVSDPDEVLLGEPEAETRQTKKSEIPDITVVALAKLSDVQRKAFLTAANIPDIEGFETAIYARGLQQLAERPGDLLILARYWDRFRKFGTLSDMIDLGITERLAERGDARRTLSGKSAEEMRIGAERLAAALVLGRSMNLHLPRELPDEPDTVDPRQVLDDWPPSEVEYLLNGGLFVPATFGLLRFYHRSAQEYLAACWFRRMGDRLTDPELERIFLAEALGIRTVPPSLRATAAWLAQWRPTLRRHLLEREPLVLFMHGDPGVLELAEKERLLAVFADRDARGDLAYSRLDHQVLWMFAEQGLASAITSAINANSRPDFRFEMLRLIEEGEIRDCLPIVRTAALEAMQRPYHCIVASRILRRLGDEEGLKAVAAMAVAGAERLGPELAPALAVELFPAHLTVDELLQIIARSKPGREYQSEGFRSELGHLFDACRTFEDRKTLVDGLAALCLEPPLGDWPKLSLRHKRITPHMAGIAARAIADSDDYDYGPGLVELLRVVERAGIERDDEPQPDLIALVAARPALRQAVFWADVAAAIAENAGGKPVRSWFHAMPSYNMLWPFAPGDEVWLEPALRRESVEEKHVALSALIELARHGSETEVRLDALAERVAEDIDLATHLADARAPLEENENLRRMREQHEAYVRKGEERKAREDQAWLKIRDRLKADPSALRDPEQLKSWSGTIDDLLNLTNWLARRRHTGRDEGARAWRHLADAFGQDVAAAYREGMSLLWRLTEPERPKPNGKGGRTIKWTIVLSSAALHLEASEDKGWAGKLTPEDAGIAVRHACLDDQGTPRWIGDLLEHHPDVAAPHVAAELAREWGRASDYRPLLELAASGMPLLPDIRSALLRLIRSKAEMSATLMALAGRILARLDLSADEREGLRRLFEGRTARYRAADNWDALVGCIAILFLLDPECAARHIFEVIAAERRRRHKSRAYQLLRALFGRHRGMVGSLEGLSPVTLAAIVAEAYRERARGTREAEDPDDPVRDRFDDAGGLALTALLGRDGAEAHRQMLWLSRQSIVGNSAHRLRELAYEMAERGSERPRWLAASLRPFEERMLAPIATGADLMGVVLDLVEAIDASFDEADMSARSVVNTAADEAAVQEWLGDALKLRGGDRFHVERESQIAHDDRPDLLISSASSPDQLAIEVKHGSMGWSLADLKAALTVQLAQKYLMPANRRHGILVISHHRETRFWKDKARKRRISFTDLIAQLDTLARTISENSNGSVRVAVRGLDTTPGRRVKAK